MSELALINKLLVFNYNENTFRSNNNPDNPWFVAKDICDILELGNTSQALSRLDEDEKGIISNDTLGGKQEMLVVNESGLYSLILTSRKPEAKRFKKWITSVVLPSIRKTGQFISNPYYKDIPSYPETLIAYGNALQEIELLKFNDSEKTKLLESKDNKIAEKEAIIQHQQPDVEYSQALQKSNKLQYIRQIAYDFIIGEKKLFDLMRKYGILQSSKVYWNLPYQRYIDLGYFKVITSLIRNKTDICQTTKMTGKGKRWLFDFLKEKGDLNKNQEYKD